MFSFSNKNVIICVFWVVFALGYTAHLNAMGEPVNPNNEEATFAKQATDEQDVVVNPHHRESNPPWLIQVPYVWSYGECFKLTPATKLNGKNLCGSYLSVPYGRVYDVNLDRSNLAFSTFGATTFIRWTFRGANMQNIRTDAHDEEVYGEAEFVDCDFTGAEIAGAEFTHISPKNLAQTANYGRRDLSNIKIGYWVHKINPNKLKQSAFADPDEDFSWSAPDPNDTQFDFSGCNLENSWLPSDLKGCNFIDAKINGARFQRYHLDGDGRSFTMEQLKSTQNYKLGVLMGVTFIGLDFSDMNFSHMNFTCTRFSDPNDVVKYTSRNSYFAGVVQLGKKMKSNLQNVVFANAIISNCDFSGTENLTLEQIKSTWNYKAGRIDGIVFPPEIQEALDAEKAE